MECFSVPQPLGCYVYQNLWCATVYSVPEPGVLQCSKTLNALVYHNRKHTHTHAWVGFEIAGLSGTFRRKNTKLLTLYYAVAGTITYQVTLKIHAFNLVLSHGNLIVVFYSRPLFFFFITISRQRRVASVRWSPSTSASFQPTSQISIATPGNRSL